MGDPTRDIDSDADEDGTDTAAILRRLGRVDGILQKASNRMAKIQAGFTTPPEPERPGILAALATIKQDLGTISAIADDLIKTTGGSTNPT
jgi:hypothetical protein